MILEIFSQEEAVAKLCQSASQVERTILEEIVFSDIVYSSYSTQLANKTMCFSDLQNKQYLLKLLRDRSFQDFCD